MDATEVDLSGSDLDNVSSVHRPLETEMAIFTSRGAHINCAIMAMLYTHSIGNQP